MEEKLHYINLLYLQNILHIRHLFHCVTLILRCKLYLETNLDQKTVHFNYWITRDGNIGLFNIHTSFIYFCTYSTSNHELEYWFVNFISHILRPLITWTLYNSNEVDKWIRWGLQFCTTFQIVELINVTAKKMSREGNVIVVREDSSVFFQTIQMAACLVGNHLSKKYSSFVSLYYLWYICIDLYVRYLIQVLWRSRRMWAISDVLVNIEVASK